jgi:hypothetical protein
MSRKNVFLEGRIDMPEREGHDCTWIQLRLKYTRMVAHDNIVAHLAMWTIARGWEVVQFKHLPPPRIWHRQASILDRQSRPLHKIIILQRCGCVTVDVAHNDDPHVTCVYMNQEIVENMGLVQWLPYSAILTCVHKYKIVSENEP